MAISTIPRGLPATLAQPAEPALPPSRAPLVLLGALMACTAYGAFFEGVTRLPRETWLQLAMLAIAMLVAVGSLYGSALRVTAPTLAWWGIGLLAAFALWSGLTILWSVAPDESWKQLNRNITYALAAALGLVLGSSLPRASVRLARAFLVVTCAVALYALAAKTIPGFSPFGLSLDHAKALARLRQPLGYWNALALVCALGVPFALRFAADPAQRMRARLAGLGALYLLFVVIGFTYSRGGIFGLAAALLVLLVLGREQLRSLALLAGTSFAVLFPLLVGFTQPDLSANNVALERRTDDALVVLVVFLVAGAALLAFGRGVIAVERSGLFGPARARAAGRLILAGAIVLALVGSIQALSAGKVGDLVDDFKATRGEALSDPSRLRSTTSGNRWTWWKEAAGAWSDKPVGGWGAGSFPVTHRMYRKDKLPVKQPHNVPLQWLAETGLVGMALALGGLLALIAAALARGRESRDGFRLAAGAAGVAWLAHSLFDWDWDIPGVTVGVLILLGVAAARPAGPDSHAGARVGDGRTPALAVVAVLIALAAVSVALPPLAQSRTEAALARAGDPRASPAQLENAAATAELAARLNPLAAEPLFVAASIAERRGSFPEARRQLLRALERQPDNVEGWYRLARIQAALGDRGGTLAAARKALTLDPLSTAALAVAVQAVAALSPPERSSTATGSPLPLTVPITDPRPGLPGSERTPAPTPTPSPSPSPSPGGSVTPTATPSPSSPTARLSRSGSVRARSA